MPVSTRSQIKTKRDENESGRKQQDLEDSNHHMRNPHYGLKEKMKALTLLYEQQKRASSTSTSTAVRVEDDSRFSFHTTTDVKNNNKVELKYPHLMKENSIPNSLNTCVLPRRPSMKDDDDDDDNVLVGGAGEKVLGFSCPRKKDSISTTTTTTTVARKLLLGVPQSEPRGGIGVCRVGTKDVQALDITVSDKLGSNGTRILVFVRLRPMGKKEKDAGSRCCVRIVNKRDIYLTEFANENDYLRLKRLRGRHFTFDASFPDTSTQHEVYTTSTAELVEAILQGRNGSVFCYGATGAGKTYTMLGTVENPGVMVLAIKDLFSKVRQRSCDGNHVVHLSYLEVYNETVRDLLSPGRPLVLREDKQGIVAAGLTQYRAYSTDEVMTLLQQGNHNRTTEPTRANETSSRSHAILQVVVEYRVRDAVNNVVSRVGKLSLIDLAGSERALATDQRTLRSLEGANINRSLLALSSCINALVEGKKHIPYRNSKLTQLLKDSLGGACNTVMIANISPSNLSFGETQNTLHWADRAKEIRTKACDGNEEILQVPESEPDQARLLLELQKENRELRAQLAKQQQKLLTAQAQSLAGNSSPAPSAGSSLLTPPLSSYKHHEKQKSRPSFLAGNCFTPESKRKKGAEQTVKDLRQTVKALEAEIERIKKDHALKIKQKDAFIRDLSRKGAKPAEGLAAKRSVTRASLRAKDATEGELRSPNHRFLSPAPTTKKRSFWDITTANSPSVVATLNGRKTRSHVGSEASAAPSMLLQPGFARQRPEPLKR